MIDLKNYSTFSQEYGFLKINEILESESVKASGVACLTEDSTLFTALDFIDACKKRNIKPIIGLTVHIGHEETQLGTVTLYAKSQEGFQSLVNIVNSITRTKDQDKLVKINDIIENKQDVIAIIGGFNSLIYKAILDKDESFLHDIISNMKESFGDDLFLEVQKNENEHDDFVNKTIKSIANGYNLKYVATNDNRFNKKGHYKLFLQKAKSVRKQKSKFDLKENFSQSNFIRTVAQSRDFYFRDMPEAIENINLINDKINDYTLTKDDLYVPTYEKSLRDVLREKYPAFIKDIPSDKVEDYKNRIQSELGVIESLGFENYFLIFDDIARNNPDLNFVLRGSSIGSLVTHMLGLSPIDPVANGLLFERFLNKGRSSRKELPDIDLETDNVDQVLAYLSKKYGESRIATLAASSTMTCKGQMELAFDTVKDDILENPLDDKNSPRFLPDKEFEIISELIRNNYGSADRVLSDELKSNPKLTKYFESNKEANKLIKMGLLFEDQIMSIKRSTGNYVITPYDYTKIYSSFKAKAKDTIDNLEHNVLELNKYSIEKVGLVKLDILANKYLSKIINTCQKLNINLENDNKYDAPEIYDMLNRGLTATINQLRSPTQAKLCQNVGISNFNDIVNIIALLRPGVSYQERMKFIEAKKKGYQGNELVESILGNTYGIIIFDEQIMKIAQKVGNFSPEDSDKLRAALKANKIDVVKEMKTPFIVGAQKLGIKTTVAQGIYNDLEYMSGKFTFSKAHSLAYAHLIYQQTWLKLNYPAEYFEFFIDRKEKPLYVNELKELGIKILPIDINRSINVYKTRIAKDSDIKGVDFSLSAVFNDNDDFSKLIVNERLANGKYKNLYDFVERLLPKYAGLPLLSSKWHEEHKVKMNFASKVESLVKIGAFDKLMPTDLNNNVLMGREVLKLSINKAIDLVLKPFVKSDFEYIAPDKEPKDKVYIDNEKLFYGGVSFMEFYQHKKQQVEKKAKLTP